MTTCTAKLAGAREDGIGKQTAAELRECFRLTIGVGARQRRLAGPGAGAADGTGQRDRYCERGDGAQASGAWPHDVNLRCRKSESLHPSTLEDAAHSDMQLPHYPS